jgi:hypothetical protein
MITLHAGKNNGKRKTSSKSQAACAYGHQSHEEVLEVPTALGA